VYSVDRPTLFRERHGWCPYSERVWLALEVMGLPYDTVRIDNTGPGVKPDYWPGGTTPQMRWADGQWQGESMNLIRALDERCGGGLYAPPDVEEKIKAWKTIFPRGARPSSRAAFLFGNGGNPLPKKEFERVLQETDDLLRDSNGPFFCGVFSAADIAWAPFLERYAAQLPCLHDGLLARSDDYPHLNRWYQAMDDQIAAYACRVKGDNWSWRKVLGMAGYGNMGNVPNDILNRMVKFAIEDRMLAHLSKEESMKQQKLWDEYRIERPYLAPTASAEAAATIVRNREAIIADVEKQCKFDMKWQAELSGNDIDMSLRELAALLVVDIKTIIRISRDANLKRQVGSMASFLDERLCVPRDMGSMSAFSIRQIAYRLCEKEREQYIWA